MRIMLKVVTLLAILLLSGCGKDTISVEQLQEKLITNNQYIETIANDILSIYDFNVTNSKVKNIEYSIGRYKDERIKNLLKVKKLFDIKIGLLKKIITLGISFQDDMKYINSHHNKYFYSIKDIESINIEKELKILNSIAIQDKSQAKLKQYYTSLINNYKEYQRLLTLLNSTDIKELIYSMSSQEKDYSIFYHSLLIILILIGTILFVIYRVDKSRMRLLMIMIISFFFLSYIFYRVAHYNYIYKKQTYQSQFLNTALDNYHTIFKTNKMLAELIFDGYIDNYEVKKLLRQNDREKLYQYLKNDYDKLKNNFGISILQFYKKDTTSFLRMYDFEDYGDKPGDIRKSIDFVNRTHQSYHGYEVGRSKGAFRNVFALIEDGEYLGSVEVSFPTEFFINTYTTNYEKNKINFLISEKALPASAINSFLKSPIDGFYFDKSVPKLKKIIRVSQRRAKKKFKFIAKKIKEGKPFTVYFKNLGELITFIPIRDKFTNGVVSSINISRKDRYFETLTKEFLIIIVIIFFAIGLLLLFIYKQIIAKYNLESSVAKALEENTKQLQTLQQQSKMAAMGEMVGAIAHQWRQPLNVISTGIQNLKYDYKDGNLNDEEFVKSFIEKNKTTIKFMSKTIDDFRSFFRIDKDKINFNVKDTTQSIINMQIAQLKNHNITLTITGEEFRYTGLQSEYQQVILNLINNAKDALISNKVENPMINIELEKNRITIADNAGGIPANIIDRVFEPYFTTKEQGKGTGMGLYMSKMIIEDNMGGTLSVSNANGGAIFYIILNANENTTKDKDE